MNKEDPPEIGKILARRIQDLCAQRSISINRLADMSGLPQQSLNSIIHGTSRNPKIISGKLHGALNIGKVKKRRNGGKHITIGVHRKDWDGDAYYPAYVEHGHGGPGPAPAHPYIRPAYDTRQDEAYEIIREGLRNALDKL